MIKQEHRQNNPVNKEDKTTGDRTPRKTVNGETLLVISHEDEEPCATSDSGLVSKGYLPTSLKKYVVNTHESLDEIVGKVTTSVKKTVGKSRDVSNRDGPNAA